MINPHEHYTYTRRWHAAGLTPDVLTSAVALRWLAYLGPAGSHALACAGCMRAWRYAGEGVRELVAVGLAVDE